MRRVVTLDGPAGSGKSTVARRLAERLGFRFLDTGAMYRAATLAALDAGVSLDPIDVDALLASVTAAKLSLDEEGGVLLRGEPVEDRIRSPEVTQFVSQVSTVPSLRSILTKMQREFGVKARPGVVAEGRDMATVVFPDADHRFFLDAKVEIRAERRRLDMIRRGQKAPTVEQLIDQIGERDLRDSTRSVAPLSVADGVTLIDSSELDIDGVVDRLEREVGQGVAR